VSADARASLISTIKFRSPGTVIGRFVAKRTGKGAAFWAVLFGVFVAAKSVGFATAYPTMASRAKIATSFGQNIGLNALFGLPRHIETVTGFTVWNTLAGMMIIGAIWGLLLATRTLRGEEDNGRWELLLAGQTTARRAAVNVLAGLAASLLVLYTVTTLTFILIGSIHKVDFGAGPALFFALAAVSGAAEFIAVGALTSQLMPTRSRAASLAAIIFGASFLLRAVGNTTSAHWLLNLSPLGWIDKLQPLYNPQPIWLIPIAIMVMSCAGVTIFLAGRRDLGASLFADKSSAEARTLLLNNPLAAALRLTRSKMLSWLIAIGLVATFFGLLTKSAAQAFGSSATAQHEFRRLTHATQILGSDTFLGIVFFLLMALMMAYAASAIGAVREEEAEGYLDNLLVRPVRRSRWLCGRILLVMGTIMAAGLLASVGIWIGVATQHAGVSFHVLFLASANAAVPAVLTLGVGVLALGFMPRLTTVIAYGVIAWSFLIELVSSGINLNHWLLDTYILHHMALAPAANADWATNLILVVVALVLCGIGIVRFNNRDLEAE